MDQFCVFLSDRLFDFEDTALDTRRESLHDMSRPSLLLATATPLAS